MNSCIKLSEFCNICRICIFYNDNLKLLNISSSLKIFQECASIDILENDVLPQHICEECKDILDKFYIFKERCKKSDQLFKKIVHDQVEQTKSSIITDNKIKLQFDFDESTDISADIEVGSLISNLEQPSKNIEIKNQRKVILTRAQQYGTKKSINKLKYNHVLQTCSTRKNTKRLSLDKKNQARKSKRDSTDRRFKCDKCDKAFEFPYMVRNHQIVHTEERSFSCVECSKYYKKSIHLEQHNKRCHNYVEKTICKICGKSIKHTYMKRHTLYHELNRSFKCSECQQDCQKRSRLEQHLKSAHNKILQVHKYLCTICGKNIVSPKDLDNHMRVHTGERPFQCKLCVKNYKTSSSLHVHVRVIHKHERPFICDVCQKRFTTRGKLKRHLQTHSNSKSHVCLVCGSAFSYDSVLKTHMKIHTI